jgi:catalase (peroxidase I)
VLCCRFNPESDYGANAGLKVARDLLEPLKKKFPLISYADLWTLAGCVAVEDMGGEQSQIFKHQKQPAVSSHICCFLS